MRASIWPSIVAAFVLSTGCAKATEPNFERAYVLAAASYCAYSVNSNDKDVGQARAVRCLELAAADPLLGELKVGAENVEAFVGPDSKDAYLLINGRKGIILAFRGTIVPPADLASTSSGGALLGPLLKDPPQAIAGLTTFVNDWLNNAKVSTNADHEHGGFAKSWALLKANLDADCGAGKCSKLRGFLDKPSSGSTPEIFVTGHSKGGALATLATRNPPKAANGVNLVVYTFASAKALDEEGVKNSSKVEKVIWRFEQDGDVVPNLPVDSSIASNIVVSAFLPVYAPIGKRVQFKADGSYFVDQPVGGIDKPGDFKRLASSIAEVFGNWLQSLVSGNGSSVITKWMLGNESACRRLVDQHFVVFSSVQKLARSVQPKPVLSDDFFSTGFHNGKDEIMWGYRQWCDLVKP